MSSTELDILRKAEIEDKIVSMYARTMPISVIIKETGYTKAQVELVLQEYRKYAMQDKVLREMSRETVLKTRQHYDEIIQRLYDAVSVANDSGDYKAEMSGLKNIADIEKQRVDFMQKAGLLADNELGDQLADMEKRQAILVDILKDVMKNYPKVGLEIQNRLAQVSGEYTGVPSERLDR